MHRCASFVAFIFVGCLAACDKPGSEPAPPTTSPSVEPGGGGPSPEPGSMGGGPSPTPEPATPPSEAQRPAPDVGNNTAAGAQRMVVVPADHPLAPRFEGTQPTDPCKVDADCHTSGCGGELCSAQAGVVTTCEVLPVTLPQAASCGCVEGECRWWSADGAVLAPAPTGQMPEPQSGEAPDQSLVRCGAEVCKTGQDCVRFYGVAGPRGPQFESCEWRCDKGQTCPDGTKCVTIADGPGQVCR